MGFVRPLAPSPACAGWCGRMASSCWFSRRCWPSARRPKADRRGKGAEAEWATLNRWPLSRCTATLARRNAIRLIKQKRGSGRRGSQPVGFARSMAPPSERLDAQPPRRISCSGALISRPRQFRVRRSCRVRPRVPRSTPGQRQRPAPAFGRSIEATAREPNLQSPPSHKL